MRRAPARPFQIGRPLMDHAPLPLGSMRGARRDRSGELQAELLPPPPSALVVPWLRLDRCEIVGGFCPLHQRLHL